MPRGIKASGGVRVGDKLDVCPIIRSLPGMWGMFRVCRVRVAKALECTVNVTGHAQVDSALFIIPGKG